MEEEKKDLQKPEKEGKESSGLALGLALGLCLGTVTKNMGLWMPIGLCLGMCLGMTFDSQKKKKDDGDDQPQA